MVFKHICGRVNSNDVVVGGLMWTVIYIAANRAQAEKMKDILIEEGILANTRATGAALAAGDGAYEILVLESEANEANEIICQYAVMKNLTRG